MFIIKPLYKSSKLPKKVYEGDAGFDVFSHMEPFRMGFGERVKIPLGFAVELPPNYVALIQEKSGMAVNQGIFTIGNVIDSTYRGEVHAIIVCLEQHIVIEKFQKVAQMLVMPVYGGTSYMIMDKLTPSSRGDKGFGSTGL